ncbi:FRG domain-containing protein [Pseudarthrobacter sp. YS3]|uniref:FRG domain-containing protein n=1 Tax=Pseudarthrobacter sp. YS3 TaxID=3453718 RepID=UPI003EEE3348
MDREAEIRKLGDLNRLIGIKEDARDRRFFEALLAPAFAISRASGANETRETFLDNVTLAGTGSHRSTKVTSVNVLGHHRAAVDCLVELDGKKYENHRIFVRSSVDSSWKLLAWANEMVAADVSPTRLKEIHGVYGLGAWRKWKEVEGLRPEDWDNLSATKCDSGRTSLQEAPSQAVERYEDLADIVSFLAVMNKNLTLLFRGQREDYPQLLPTLQRPTCPPDARWAVAGTMDANRAWYWNKLEGIEEKVREVLFEKGLPRWRHIRDSRFARWAVIQHYELWPTPMLDFSTSLRVAATFAFGEPEDFNSGEHKISNPSAEKSGFLYITGVDRLQSDLMALPDNDAVERSNGLVTVRLNAVCPPRAVRPHLQEGVLVCRYPFDGDWMLDPGRNDFSSRLIAKIKLIDRGSFWSPDFPRLTKRALLPTVDQLGDDLCSRVFPPNNDQPVGSKSAL